MATPVVFNAVNYSVPAFGDVGYAQGPGNLSAYLIALATGTFQPTGGLFSLTADADFGPNFGLKSVYYKTQGSPIALSGVFRMARTEFIAWRDQANANDLELGVNTSNQLTYNGVAISSSSGALIGTTLTLTATSNQMVIGTGTTTTVSFTAPAVSAVYTVPDVGTTADFVMTAGAQTIAGAKTFTNTLTFPTPFTLGAVSVTATGTEMNYLVGVSSALQAQINLKSPLASPTFTGTVTIPTPFTLGATSVTATGTEMNYLVGVTSLIQTQLNAKATDSLVVHLAGTETITGAKTFQSSTLLLQEAGSTDVATIAVASLAASRVYTVPDAGAAASFLMTQGAQTIVGTNTFTSTSGIIKNNGSVDDTTFINFVAQGHDSTARLNMKSFYTTAITTSPKKIFDIAQYSNLALVAISNGANVSTDLIWFAFAGTVSVISAFSGTGTVPVRTYSVSSGDLRVALASGSGYTATVFVFESRTF